MHNKSQAHDERAMIEENRACILRNYGTALANRMMAEHNTDVIFNNRKSILSWLLATSNDDLQTKLNEAQIDFLEHRSKLTSLMAAVNLRLSEINAMLIGTNGEIMEGNALLVSFNTAAAAQNLELMEFSFEMSEESNAEANAARMVSNLSRIDETKNRAITNRKQHESDMETVNAIVISAVAMTDAAYIAIPGEDKPREHSA